MTAIFNSTAPISVRETYQEFNQVDFLVQLKANSIVKNSFRLNGRVKVMDGLGVRATEAMGIFLNAFSGISSVINVASVSVNSTQVIENVSSFGRLVGMKRQAKYTLPQLTASSLASLELCGNRNNLLLLGEKEKNDPEDPDNNNSGYISFSMAIDNCLNNMMGGDIHPAKINEMRLMLTLESALNAFHINKETSITTGVTYLLKDLLLTWTEVAPQPKPEPIGVVTHFLTQQTLVSKNTNLNIMSGTLPADALSISFIRQKNRSQVKRDGNLCEFIGQIQRVEFEINSSQSVNMYPLLSYGDIALNYYRSFSSPNAPLLKNSITSLATNGTCAFGIGILYPESQSNRLTMNITIADDANSENDPASQPDGAIDAFCFTNSLLTL
jgi:hypothetical protein